MHSVLNVFLPQKGWPTKESQKETRHWTSREGMEHMPTSWVPSSTSFETRGSSTSTCFSALAMLILRLSDLGSWNNLKWSLTLALVVPEASHSQDNPSTFAIAVAGWKVKAKCGSLIKLYCGEREQVSDPARISWISFSTSFSFHTMRPKN